MPVWAVDAPVPDCPLARSRRSPQPCLARCVSGLRHLAPAGCLLLALVGGCGAGPAAAPVAPGPMASIPAPVVLSTPAASGPAGSVTSDRSTAADDAPRTDRPGRTGPVWVVGATPLPVGPDGFAEVRPTPAALRDRRLQAADVLPPPSDGQFHVDQGPITPALAARMGETYRPGCPVPHADLRHLTLTFRGFDGAAHTGELVVAARAAGPTGRAFARLFALGFPIEQMRLPTTADLTAAPTGDGNDTAGFVCRAARGQTRFSAHAYGLAIDVNPFQNPFVRGPLILPELAGAYVDRQQVRAGMFLAGSPAVRAFTDQGFTWGGTFRTPLDYQHFSLTGD